MVLRKGFDADNGLQLWEVAEFSRHLLVFRAHGRELGAGVVW